MISWLYILFIFKNDAQSMYGMAMIRRIHNGINIKIMMKYVVDTKDFPFSHWFNVMASVNLFFSPRVNPISKKLIHIIMDDNVSQIP